MENGENKRTRSSLIVVLGGMIGALALLPVEQLLDESLTFKNCLLLMQPLLGGGVAAYIFVHIVVHMVSIFWDPKDRRKLIALALIGGLASQPILKGVENIPVNLLSKLYRLGSSFFEGEDDRDSAADATDSTSKDNNGGWGTSDTGKEGDTISKSSTIFSDSAEGKARWISAIANATGSLEDLEVLESTFCLKVTPQECQVSTNSSEEIYLSDIETIKDNVRRIIFWTSMKADKGPQNIVHVWSSSKRPDKWYKTVHITTGNKVKNFTRQDKDHLQERLLAEIERGDPDIHAVQAVVLSLDRSPRFRTYSSLRAIPGKYTVDLRYPDGQKIFSSKKANTITIKKPPPPQPN